MAAPVGNKFWLQRASHGKEKIFTSPNILWDAACEYFEWAENNPLQEQKVFSYQGAIVKGDATKMRAMTMEGLCLFLDIGVKTWYDYRGREDYAQVVSKIENVIRSQKFAGAAADLLNANIIARDLGLKDTVHNEHSGTAGHSFATGLDAIDKTLESNPELKEQLEDGLVDK